MRKQKVVYKQMPHPQMPHPVQLFSELQMCLRRQRQSVLDEGSLTLRQLARTLVCLLYSAPLNFSDTSGRVEAEYTCHETGNVIEYFFTQKSGNYTAMFWVIVTLSSPNTNI